MLLSHYTSAMESFNALRISPTFTTLTKYLVLSILLLLTTGCQLLSLQEQVETVYESKVIVGMVVDLNPSQKSPVVVAAYSKHGSARIIEHYTLLHEPSPYELMVSKGSYFIFAFKDLNGDFIYQANEPVGQYSSDPLVIDDTGGVLLNIDILLPRNPSSNIDFPPNTKISGDHPPKSHSSSPGALMSVTDPLFAEENAVKGYWQPWNFFHDIGGNIYFREPYSPSKTPVLFVHGAVGTPANWTALLETLDSNLYQPWYFYYPSGASIKSMADLLFWKISNLHHKYRFQKMYIVAHSMGGLVARSLLVDYGEIFPFIKKFISISTPWSGDVLSEMGVKYSPGVIPAWKDMGRESEFVQSIYRKRLPKNLQFFLFFGHKGNRSLFRGNNDGVVTLASQLDHRVQSEAKMIYGFKEDHNSILSSERVASLLNTILVPEEETSEISDSRGGYIKVSTSIAPGNEGNIRWPLLYVEQTDKNKKDGISITLGPIDAIKNIGPLVPGNYRVSYVAEGFMAEPIRAAISIGQDTSTSLHFTLQPVGSIFDYVRHKFYDEGDPAGTYMMPAEDIKIDSIRLVGNNIDRLIVPTSDPDSNDLEKYFMQEDWVKDSIFAFYNLPEGDYNLIITAEGYKPCTIQRKIVLGEPDFFKGIVIEPLPENN